MNEDKNNSIVTYNNTQFEFELILVNEYYNIYIPNSNIESIEITDDLYNVFNSAKIIINNSRNYLDVFTTYKQGVKQIIQNKSFNFLGSGNDYFILHIKPKEENLLSTDPSGLKEDIFAIDLQLAIFDEDEVIGDNNQKLRVFKCADIREYILQTDKRGYNSIGEPNFAKNLFLVRQLDDISKFVHTGDFIKYVIEQSLKETNPTFDADWDSGQTQISYSNAQDYSAYDTIEYTLDNHTSAVENDNCLLKFERNGNFSLRSFSKYFERNRVEDNSGPYMQDFFAFEDNVSKAVDNNKPLTNEEKKKLMNSKKFSFKNITNLANMPQLPEFNFLNRTGFDGFNYLISYGVNIYDLTSKTFSILQKEHSVESQKNYIDEKYTKKFGGKDPTTAYYIDGAKKDNILFQPEFCLPGSSIPMRLKYGRNIATKKYIDSSPCISFTTEGYSHRQSGRFMSITNTQIETESVFANLLCGEWLVTKIVHTFRKGKYENEITGVKTYFYNKVAAPDNNSKAEQIDKLSGLGI